MREALSVHHLSSRLWLVEVHHPPSPGEEERGREGEQVPQGGLSQMAWARIQIEGGLPRSPGLGRPHCRGKCLTDPFAKLCCELCLPSGEGAALGGYDGGQLGA